MKALQVIIIILSCSTVFSQNISRDHNTKSINIRIVEPDSNLCSLVDSLLYYEQKCSYYSDTLTYGVWINKSPVNNGDSIVTLYILGSYGKEFFINDYARDTPFGYCTYKRHSFFFFGRNDLVFVAGNKKRLLEIPEYYAEEDDRWASYLFIYNNKGTSNNYSFDI